MREQLAELAIGVEIETLLSYEGACVYGAHTHQAITKGIPAPKFAQVCMGDPRADRPIQSGPWAPMAGEIDRLYRRSFGNHAGGTSQLKRMVMATRILGLAR